MQSSAQGEDAGKSQITERCPCRVTLSFMRYSLPGLASAFRRCRADILCKSSASPLFCTVSFPYSRVRGEAGETLSRCVNYGREKTMQMESKHKPGWRFCS